MIRLSPGVVPGTHVRRGDPPGPISDGVRINCWFGVSWLEAGGRILLGERSFHPRLLLLVRGVLHRNGAPEEDVVRELHLGAFQKRPLVGLPTCHRGRRGTGEIHSIDERRTLLGGAAVRTAAPRTSAPGIWMRGVFMIRSPISTCTLLPFSRLCANSNMASRRWGLPGSARTRELGSSEIAERLSAVCFSLRFW